MLSVTSSLRGKTIFITGTTGFVGKVLLEKILRDVPEIKRIYLLIRGKSEERLHKEIFKSKIFTRLKAQREDFEEYVKAKTKAVSGDVLFDNAGLSPKDLQALQSEVNYVVHCAATVDFRERLDNAVRKNVLGTLQLFDVAKTFKHLSAFIHVSTAYVNCDRTGYHAEELPPLNFDPEETVQLILQMDPKELERATPQLIGHYPNTYTYTKAITERLLEKRRGNVPVCYVRPTIVGAAWREPVPGWIDSVSAIAAVILYTGVGLVRFIQGNKDLVCDIVPVDVVCNVILAAIPAAVPEKINIFHAGTSQVNPVRWRESARWVSTYWRQHNVKRRVDKRPLKFKFYKTRLGFRTQFFLKYEVPAALYSYFANTIGTSAHKEQAQLLEKVTQRTRIATETFVHFTSSEFIFGVENTERLIRQLTPEDRSKFFFHLQELDWEKYYRFFCFGMQKYVLQEEVKPPTELLKIDLVKEPRKLDETQAPTWFSRNFPDLAWSYKQYKVNSGIDNFNTLRTPAETKALILKSPKIREVIKKTAEKEGIGMEKVESRAAAVLDKMAHNLRLPVIRALGYFLRKVWRRIYHGIHVEEKGLEALKKSLGNGPVILVPTHRSYVDFLIVSYIFFEYDLPIPHIAAGEDFLAVMFVNWIFRNSGAFFLRRSFKGDELYTALFTEYVQRLIADWSPIEFFIEGKRSRSGKCLHPKFGMLYISTEPFLEKKVPDTTIVPISISYERVIEAELFTNELLGEQKTKESLEGLIRASKILKMNFGRINVIFNSPISLKDYASKAITASSKPSFDPFKNMDDRRHFVRELGYKITHELNSGLAYTTTALVATVILTHRKGITAQDLVTKVDWLREEVHLHGGNVAFEGTSEDLVSEGLKLLHSLVSKSRNMFVPAVDKGTDKPNKSIIVLDFYRNQLLHLFTAEGMIACVLSSSALSGKDHGISKEELIKDTKFLANLLKLEFVNRPTEHGHEDFAAVADKLAERGLLNYSKDANPIVTFTSKGEGHLAFLCHMFWPLIDAYWVAAISLFSLQPNLTSKRRPLVQKMAWLADKMHSELKISFFESCSMEVLSNCLDLYNQWKIIDYKAPKVSQQSSGKKGAASTADQDVIVSLVSTYQQEGSLLDLVETINKYRKVPPAFYSNRANLRRAVLSDFPVLAKL